MKIRGQGMARIRVANRACWGVGGVVMGMTSGSEDSEETEESEGREASDGSENSEG